MKNTYYKTTFYLSILFLSVLSSCSESSKTVDDGCYFENFDNLKMWHSDARVITTQVHSGSYAAFTDSLNEYSETFQMDFAYAKSKGYKTMTVTGWCYKNTDDVKAGLVTSVEGPDQSLVNESINLTEALKKSNEWGQVTSNIKLPETASPGTKIKVYLWSPKKQNTFLDDLTIEFHK